MNLGFYGHSNCAYRSQHSFLDIVANKFNAKIVNTGVRQGSEERILFELKKTKKLDVAVIFHSQPQYIFLPNSDRDISIKSISESRSEYIFRNWDNDFVREHHKLFVEEFKDATTFINSVDLYKEHFFNPDLQLNRFYGSLIQIDQYLINKNIFAIHVLEKSNSIPTWFYFQSGVVDFEIMTLCKKYHATNPFFVNCISEEGNVKVAEHLEKIMRPVVDRNTPEGLSVDGGSNPPAAPNYDI